MKIDNNSIDNINGYTIKNTVCKTNEFKLCDAVDKDGNSFVLKIFPENVKVDILKEEHVIESFVHSDKLYIIYAEHNFASEGLDYFSYYLDKPSSQNCELKSIISKGDESKEDTNLDKKIIGERPHTGHLAFTNLAKANHLFHLGLGSCANRMRTPIPKECNFMPHTPNSFESEMEDSEESEDSEFDDGDDDDEDEENLTYVSEDSSDTNQLVPILNSNVISNNGMQHQAPDYVNTNTHIHIECPLQRIIHSKHMNIRKTPVPREMRSEDYLKIQQEELKMTNNVQFKEPPSKCSPNEKSNFKLQMLHSSVLKRRNSSQCLYTT